MVPMNQSNPVWKVLKEESVYEARPFLEVWQQEVKLPDGSIIPDYHRVWVIDYALIWAETSDGKVILEKQYKHGVGEVTCTFPSGGIEPGESPQLAAERELLEETGYTATAWESLGAYPVQGNYGCGRAHFFRATGATQTSTPRNGDLEDIEVMAVSPEEIHTLIREKKLVLLDCLSLVGALSVYFHE
jgi:ADP-ribose pyrophosphatase